MSRVFEKGDFILGQGVKDFETEFAKYCEVQYAIGVNSGTDALYLALSSFDIGVGDEVIIPYAYFYCNSIVYFLYGGKTSFC